jgi:hypothetical protein
MKLLLGCLALFLVICSSAGPVNCAAALNLAADANALQCVLADPGPNNPLVWVYAFISYETSATAVAFALPVPAASGLTFLADASPFTVTGESPTGVLVQFGTCLTGKTMVMSTLYFRSSAPTPCTMIVPGPHPQLGAYRTDCSFAQAPFQYAGLLYAGTEGCAGPIPPSNPSPANGAADVALMPALNWDDDIQVCTGLLSTIGDGVPGDVRVPLLRDVVRSAGPGHVYQAAPSRTLAAGHEVLLASRELRDVAVRDQCNLELHDHQRRRDEVQHVGRDQGVVSVSPATL